MPRPQFFIALLLGTLCASLPAQKDKREPLNENQIEQGPRSRRPDPGPPRQPLYQIP